MSRQALCVLSILAASLLPTSLGCAPMTTARFLPNENSSLLRAPRDPAQILVVPEGAPSRPYRVVGSMVLSLNSATAGTLFTNLAWFTERFRERAAAAGADGIMNLRVVRSGTSGFGTREGRTELTGTATEILEMTAEAFVLTSG